MSTLPATLLNRTSSGQNEVCGSDGCCIGHTDQADGFRPCGADQGIRTDIGDDNDAGKGRSSDAERGNIEPVLASHRVGIEADDLIGPEARCEHEDIVATAGNHHVVTGTASDRIVANSAIDKVNAGSTQQYVVSVTTEQ